MPIINSRSSNFIFVFPKGFFVKKIVDKYTPYVKRHPLPYDTIDTFMSAQIQSISFPSINMDPVSQTRYRGKQQEYKNSVPIADLFTRDVEITFKTLDGYINYWIFLENMLEHLDFQNKEQYLDDLQMRFLDQEGRVVMGIKYIKPVFTGMSEISLSYSDNNPEFKTFSARFSFFKMDLSIEHD